MTSQAAFIISALFLLAGTGAADARVRRALLSVDGLNHRPNEVVQAFHIETWGVEFLSVCFLPKSWEVKSEKFEDPEGWLDGKADAHGTPLTLLPEMFLVDVYDYQPLPKGDPKRDYHPPSFSGWVQIGVIVPFEGGPGKKLVLRAHNFRLKAARTCPIPPPARP